MPSTWSSDVGALPLVEKEVRQLLVMAETDDPARRPWLRWVRVDDRHIAIAVGQTRARYGAPGLMGGGSHRTPRAFDVHLVRKVEDGTSVHVCALRATSLKSAASAARAVVATP